MKTRTRRRPSTRSADQDGDGLRDRQRDKAEREQVDRDDRQPRVAAGGAIHMQLTKLNAATAAQISPCHQRNLKASSNSARVNSQNTTTLPVDSAISGACQTDTGEVAPIA